jgi:hypothetical protein
MQPCCVPTALIAAERHLAPAPHEETDMARIQASCHASKTSLILNSSIVSRHKHLISSQGFLIRLNVLRKPSITLVDGRL